MPPTHCLPQACGWPVAVPCAPGDVTLRLYPNGTRLHVLLTLPGEPARAWKTLDLEPDGHGQTALLDGLQHEATQALRRARHQLTQVQRGASLRFQGAGQLDAADHWLLRQLAFRGVAFTSEWLTCSCATVRHKITGHAGKYETESRTTPPDPEDMARQVVRVTLTETHHEPLRTLGCDTAVTERLARDLVRQVSAQGDTLSLYAAPHGSVQSAGTLPELLSVLRGADAQLHLISSERFQRVHGLLSRALPRLLGALPLDALPQGTLPLGTLPGVTYR